MKNGAGMAGASRLVRLFDFVFALRPTLLFAVWTVALAGLWMHERQLTGAAWYLPAWPLSGLAAPAALELALFTLLMGAAFLLNQLSDIESDRLNNKLFLIASGAISPRRAWGEIVVLLTVALAGLVLLDPRLAGVAAAAWLVTGWLYSSAPFRCKDRPWAGLWCNLAGSLLIFVFGWMMAGPAEWAMALYAVPYVLGIGAVYCLTTIPDLPGDAASGKITPAVRWGEVAMRRAALGFDSAALLAACWLGDGVAAVATLAVWPFFLGALRQGGATAALRTNKYATLFLSLLICWRLPAYLLLLALVFYLGKWYYAARFQMDYPSLRS